MAVKVGNKNVFYFSLVVMRTHLATPKYTGKIYSHDLLFLGQ